MRDYAVEAKNRIAFLQGVLKTSGTSGFVFGNSGGKDCALVGILCKKACDNTLSVLMPCQSKRNHNEDKVDAFRLAEQFDIKSITIDLGDVKTGIEKLVGEHVALTTPAQVNIAPRLRMTTLYTLAASRNSLVVGTGNRSEAYMGYFTKYGDGAYDVNPIADLTVTEVYEFLRFFNAPESIIQKAPSAGLFDGQTDEHEMGITYCSLDTYILTGQGDAEMIEKVEKEHAKTAHKRRMPLCYNQE